MRLFPLTALSFGAGAKRMPPRTVFLSVLLQKPKPLSWPHQVCVFPFIISELCRSQADNDARDQSCAIVLLAKRPYGESLVLLKQVGEHLGLALNSQSFGIRVKPSQVSTFRSSCACFP